MRRRYPLLCLIGVLALHRVAALATPTEETVHCSSACKVYVDGELIVSLKGDNIRTFTIPIKGNHRILITRMGKPTRVYNISGNQQFVFDADLAQPTLAGAGQQADSDPPAKVKTQADSKRPDWLRGRWETSGGLIQRQVQLRSGSASCSATYILSVMLVSDEDTEPHLDYNQQLNTDLPSTNDPTFDVCADLLVNKIKDKSDAIDIEVPVRFIRFSESEVDFEADMTRCKSEDHKGFHTEACPAAITAISGHIRRTGDGITMHWVGPLASVGDTPMSRSN